MQEPGPQQHLSTRLTTQRSLIQLTPLSRVPLSSRPLQRLSRRQYARTSIIKTKDRGHGLIASAPIAAHSLVLEYCGEVISLSECYSRLSQYQSNGIFDFYMFQLSPHTVIDAQLYGNAARFINHSCDANAYTQTWTVGAQQRVGIWAKRDIEVGEEVTYNYNAQTFNARGEDNAAIQHCRCGSFNCSRYLGEKVKHSREKDKGEGKAKKQKTAKKRSEKGETSRATEKAKRKKVKKESGGEEGKASIAKGERSPERIGREGKKSHSKKDSRKRRREGEGKKERPLLSVKRKRRVVQGDGASLQRAKVEEREEFTVKGGGSTSHGRVKEEELNASESSTESESEPPSMSLHDGVADPPPPSPPVHSRPPAQPRPRAAAPQLDAGSETESDDDDVPLTHFRLLSTALQAKTPSSSDVGLKALSVCDVSERVETEDGEGDGDGELSSASLSTSSLPSSPLIDAFAEVEGLEKECRTAAARSLSVLPLDSINAVRVL